MKAIYSGSFDPVTLGHLDVIERAAKIFDEVIVLLMRNPRKKYTFEEEDRKQMIEVSLKGRNMENVCVVIGQGLTVDMCRELGANVIIRGIRAVTDYEYELMQATANQKLNESVETLMMIAKPEYSFLSSSVVKEIAINGGDITPFMPAEIVEHVREVLEETKTV